MFPFQIDKLFPHTNTVVLCNGLSNDHVPVKCLKVFEKTNDAANDAAGRCQRFHIGGGGHFDSP